MLALATMSGSNAALADTFTYEFTWSGQWAYGPGPYGDSDARASAVVVMESTADDPGLVMDRIASVTMTVVNADIGNGTFSKSDFTNIETSFRLVPTLPLNERYRLSSYDMYDVRFWSDGSGAPTQFASHTMWAGGVQGANALYLDTMYVTRTLTSAVPEPATYGMLLGGLALVGALARRRAGAEGR
jgi:hypothetical protein